MLERLCFSQHYLIFVLLFDFVCILFGLVVYILDVVLDGKPVSVHALFFLIVYVFFFGLFKLVEGELGSWGVVDHVAPGFQVWFTAAHYSLFY